MISVIIPSYKDPLLNKTIQSLLDGATGDIEIIPVLDGYVQEVLKDLRVKPLYLEKNGGMRNAINQGVKQAKGEYLMRSDEHCMFAPGYDIALTEMEDNWIVTPRRYFLDPVKWEVMDKEPVDYEKLVISGNHHKFSGLKWDRHDRKELIDETMMIQGSCWFMKKSWWDKVIGELDTEHMEHYQDQTEMAFKTWQAGGKLMVNKKTWFAHKHRDFPRTHKYSNQKARKTWDYARSVWEPYYRETILPKWTPQFFI